MRRRLRQTFERARRQDVADETRADLARFLCVRVSGFVERAVVELLSAYAEDLASPQIAAFVQSELRYTTNLGATKLLDLLGAFDGAWRVDLEAFFSKDPEAKDALDAVVAKRHRIAHGFDDGVGLVAVGEWFAAVDRLVVQVEGVVDPV